MIFIGLAYDIGHISRTLSEICDGIHECFDFNRPFLENDRFLELADNLAGRFAILLIRGDNIFALNDPCGLRRVYYHTRHICLASHYGLINLFTNDPLINDFKEMYREHCRLDIERPRSLWGDQSPYEFIRLLVPNYWLELPGHKIRRFFPRERNIPGPLEEAAKFLADHIRLVMERLNLDFNIYLSLTTGYDSRTSLAACKNIKDDIILFSYYFEGNAKATYQDFHRSLAFCRRLSRRFKIRHEEFNLTGYHLTPEEKAELNECFLGAHEPELAFFRSFFKGTKSINLRSNIYEVIKGNHWDIFPDASDERIAHFMTIASNIPRTSTFYNRAKEYYQDYIARYDIRQVLDLGYNHGDLFYAEFRGGQWLASVYAEPDSAIDTFTPINCRQFFKAAFGIPQELKNKNLVEYKMIFNNWPELLDDYKYPNTPCPIANLTDYIDFRTSIEFNYLQQYEELHNIRINSYNLVSKREHIHFKKINYNCILFGFNTGELLHGDTVELELKLPTRPNICYRLNFSLLINNPLYKSEFDLKYEIWLNGKPLFIEKYADFTGINQFLYIGNSHDLREFRLTIKIINSNDASSVFNNSLLKLSNLTFSPEPSFQLPEFYTLTSAFLRLVSRIQENLATTTPATHPNQGSGPNALS